MLPVTPFSTFYADLNAREKSLMRKLLFIVFNAQTVTAITVGAFHIVKIVIHHVILLFYQNPVGICPSRFYLSERIETKLLTKIADFMKKLNIVFMSVLLAVLAVSCSKDAGVDDLNVTTKSSSVISTSTPISYNGIAPVIISGANRGGNRTCDEVASAFNTTFDLCGDKLDYTDIDFDGDYEFSGQFPDGLNVTVNGNFVSFSSSGCLLIGGKYFKVGAVIVKGSASANIYYYPDGTNGDSGLAAPGGNRMVSNLTFCFYECDDQPQVIAIKCVFNEDGYNRFGVTSGTNYFYPSANGFWCADWFLGVNAYPFTGPLYLNQAGLFDTIVGEANLVDGKIVITLYGDRQLQYANIYIGTLDGLINANLDAKGCPIYTNLPPWILIEY